MVRRSALACVLAFVVAFGFLAVARAQGSDVQIVKLDCNSEPEVVVIQNLGDATQDLTGWSLESDPPGEEVFDLFGTLKQGESTSIALGKQFVYRDDDPTDYARIVDETGATVHQVNCAGGAAATPAPTASPTPSPEASPPADVPNGGGPPPVDNSPTSVLMIVLGGSMLVIGLAAFALPQMSLAPSPSAGHAAASGSETPPSPNPSPRRNGRGRHNDGAVSLRSRLGLIETALTVAAVILSSWWREGSD